MARIELNNLCHSYRGGSDFAIRDLNLVWEDGTANALLGPSGCGKTTLLNILSGLLQPTSGAVLLNGTPVTGASPKSRTIAQVFQFPVVYDTMTVFGNLAFPLKNGGHSSDAIRRRVAEIAALLDLEPLLDRPAGRLNPAEKQVVSLGRGIVRKDTAAVLLDEPLTVIDPVLKLSLRRKLRQAQKELGITMIYVTHDQHEAMTFADHVTIMKDGEAVQTAAPTELFRNPRTPFVGYFIGSPGMNRMPFKERGGQVEFAGGAGLIPEPVHARASSLDGTVELGIRPEYVEISAVPMDGWSVFHLRESDFVGAYRILTLDAGPLRVRARADGSFHSRSGDEVWVRFPENQLKIYHDGLLVES